MRTRRLGRHNVVFNLRWAHGWHVFGSILRRRGELNVDNTVIDIVTHIGLISFIFNLIVQIATRDIFPIRLSFSGVSQCSSGGIVFHHFKPAAISLRIFQFELFHVHLGVIDLVLEKRMILVIQTCVIEDISFRLVGLVSASSMLHLLSHVATVSSWSLTKQLIFFEHNRVVCFVLLLYRAFLQWLIKSVAVLEIASTSISGLKLVLFFDFLVFFCASIARFINNFSRLIYTL